MTGVFAMLGLTRPTTLGEKGDGAVQAVISGLSHHSEALVTGYAVCLAVLLIRAQVLSQRATRNDPGPRLRA